MIQRPDSPKLPIRSLKVLLAICLLGLGCVRVVGSGAIPNDASTKEASGILRNLISAGRLSDLQWPDLSEYKTDVKTFYEPGDYSPAWSTAGEPTQQARDLIGVLQSADAEGLNGEDYDASRWPDRLKQLKASPSPDSIARFDLSVTVCAMRYISDLHIGRVNPQHLKFALDVGSKKYDLPLLLRTLVGSQNVRNELDSVDPPFAGYRRTQDALRRYEELARQDDGQQLPVPKKAIGPGDSYSGIARLTRLLHILGDLPDRGSSAPETNVYNNELTDAVKRFQQRHGLSPDGRLGQETVKQLNTPLAFRVQQLSLTLERWRWIPYTFSQPPIVVNIPEFRLRAYDSAGKVGFESNVIVGKAYRHQTPVFERNMRFVVFRPYWNVPPSIRRSEIVPAIRKDRNYIANKNYEITSAEGAVVTSGEVTNDLLEQLSAGRLSVRQKPGPTNALGLVKLMFPNEYNVYLHSTPSLSLFSQSRRDFSHGCIRVEKADELAAWVLQDKREWTLEQVRAAMQKGKDNVQVDLSQPVPVLILYGTAIVDEGNKVHFFNDIYGHDTALQKALAQLQAARR